MVLNGIAGSQEKRGGSYIVPAMASHASELSTGFAGLQALRASYGPAPTTAPAVRTKNTLG